MKSEALRSLYNTNTTAKIFFDFLSSKTKNVKVSTVESTVSVVSRTEPKVSRKDVVEMFEKLDELECGQYIRGRIGHKARFEWDINALHIARFSTGEEPILEFYPQSFDGQTQEFVEMRVHRFNLRENMEVELTLPLDLSENEAKRLSSFVLCLPFDECD
ncbi:hypothetical protein [Algicola sagamiensis]|uniref:hypothetical protein n=1 Tax=Algicola sagamiensis TaxID=163869 RepID=UPI0003798AD9|nr:hypothetical protein [Algicola sagamiensis]